MNTPHTLSACLVAMLCSACGGGGGGDISPSEAARLLFDQTGECFAVAAGRTAPDRFNATAAEIASVPMAEVCLAWPAGGTIDCRTAYAALTKPYSGADQCRTVSG